MSYLIFIIAFYCFLCYISHYILCQMDDEEFTWTPKHAWVYVKTQYEELREYYDGNYR